ncbi:hypothetical protein Bca52824_000869 [Brassica carinata]|uniref:Uncharacterized protein n=1 Tax=Brassica carinata TaxID=52824 RepID=A0A8X7WHA1_BRACI|nr:hypothetical protein Bca52824_000869 [Brassica carinata]
MTFLDLRALEVRLLRGACSSCFWHVSEHVVVLCEAQLWSGVGGVVYGSSKVMLRPSSQSSFLFPSSWCRQPKSVSICSWLFHFGVVCVQASTLPQVQLLSAKSFPWFSEKITDEGF